MWHWIRDHRRRSILETPFPPEWESYLEGNVVHYRRLDENGRKHLRDLTQLFIAEKHWEGCGGLELTDEIRVTIAAQACLLVLALDATLFDSVLSILIYPREYVVP